MSLPEIRSEAFKQAALRSERIRIIGLLGGSVAMLVVVLLRALFFGSSEEIQYLPGIVVILVFLMAYESLVWVRVHRLIQSEQDLPSWASLLNLFIETLVPTTALILMTQSTVLAAIIHKFGVSVDFLRKFRAESVFRCDYKASKLVEPNRDEARAPSGNSSARRGLYICVGAGSQGTVRWDTDGASVMRRAFVRDKTMPGAPRCDEKFPEPGHRF